MTARTWVAAVEIRSEMHKLQVTTAPVVTDSITATCNGRELKLVFGNQGLTINDAAKKIAQLLTTGMVIDDEHYCANGNQIGEFAGIKVTVNNDCVVVQGFEDRPHGMTFDKSGTIAWTTTPIQLADGPHHGDTAGNWSPSGIPGNGDDLTFDHGNIDCKYGLALEGEVATITRTNDYTGNIGLPVTNMTNPNAPFSEYLDTHLDLVNDEATITVVNLGTDVVKAVGFTHLDFNSHPATVNVINAPVTNIVQQAVPGAPKIVNELPFDFIGCNGGDFTVKTGRGHISGLIDNLYIGIDGSNWIDCEAEVTGLTVKSGGTLLKRSGTHTGVLNSNAGTTIFESGTIVAAPVVRGGQFICNSDDPTEYPAGIKLYGDAVLDFSQDSRPKKLAGPIQRHGKNCKVRDPHKIVEDLAITQFGSDFSALAVDEDGTWTRS